VAIKARCPVCGRTADINDNMDSVRCPHCGLDIAYDEYIEIMKNRAVNMADDYQMNWKG